MATCSRCNQEIIFKAHPKAPDKTVPFDVKGGVVGELHFVTCKSTKQKKVYSLEGLEEIECSYGHSCRFVVSKTFKSGERFGAYCAWGHFIKWIPPTKENRQLIFKTMCLRNYTLLEQWTYLSLKEVIETCLNFENDLNEWSKTFVKDLQERYRFWADMSKNQKDALNMVWRNLGSGWHDLIYFDRKNPQTGLPEDVG